MVTVTFLNREGLSRDVEAPEGSSAMAAAVQVMIPGIDGDCGGVCSCATCHVHVTEPWVDKVGPPDDHERALLDFAEGVTEVSRLSCQIILTEDLDGLALLVP